MKRGLLVLFLVLIASEIALADVVINEIVYNPEGTDSGHEWIEIYADENVNITGWKLFEDGTNHALTLIYGSWILKGYAVIADDYNTFLSDYPNFNTTLLDTSWSSLSNSGEYIAIKDNFLNIINGVNYSTEFANGNSKSLSFINGSWLEANPTPGYENTKSSEIPEEPKPNLTTHDIKLEVYLEDEINLDIEQTSLFKITNLNPELGKVYNITVYYNVTKENLLIEEGTFTKSEVNYYSTSGTGYFLPKETGTYTICGIIISSSINDNNLQNDYACKNFVVINTISTSCNITINITTDKEIYSEGESVKFYNNLNNEEFPFIIEYWIEDFFGNIYKTKYNTTNTNQKSWNTDIEEQDRVLFIKSKLYPKCNDLNLSDNYAEKMFIVRSEYNESENIIEKDEESILEILEVDDNVKFGDVANVKVKIYKGNTNKYSISLWIEDGEKISETTKIHLYDKYSSYNGQLPIMLKPNCDQEFDDGNYYIVLSGFDKEARKKIKIERISEDNCQGIKQTVEKKSTSQKKFEYDIVDYPYFIKVGEEFIARVKVANNDNSDYDISAWSYVYRGSKSYSGDKEQNKQSFDLLVGEARVIELKNIILDAEPGQYNLKIKINKNNQKTDYEITKPITIEETKKASSTEKNENIQSLNKSDAMPEWRPQLIYESSTYKAKKLVAYSLIGTLTFLVIVLIWNKK